jgi:hypothetical protein
MSRKSCGGSACCDAARSRCRAESAPGDRLDAGSRIAGGAVRSGHPPPAARRTFFPAGKRGLDPLRTPRRQQRRRRRASRPRERRDGACVCAETECKTHHADLTVGAVRERGEDACPPHGSCSFRRPSRAVAEHRGLDGNENARGGFAVREFRRVCAPFPDVGGGGRGAERVRSSEIGNGAKHVPGGAVHPPARAGGTCTPPTTQRRVHSPRSLKPSAGHLSAAAVVLGTCREVPGTCREVPAGARHVLGTLS